METLLIILHIVVCLFLIVIVLLQHGKGADIGASFGGSGQALFGTEGPLPLLNKITTWAAIIFMMTSISLAYLSTNKGVSIMSNVEDVAPQPAPVEALPSTQQDPLTIPMPTADSETKDDTAGGFPLQSKGAPPVESTSH